MEPELFEPGSSSAHQSTSERRTDARDGLDVSRLLGTRLD